MDCDDLLSQKERELEERNEELEAQHEELTAAIEAMTQKNRYLEEALREINVRNREIDQIVYRVSHDLKAPITSLEGIFSLLSSDKDVELGEYLDLAHKSTAEMKQRLQMLTRYSNILVSEEKKERIDFDLLWRELQIDLHEIEGYDRVKINFKNKIKRPVLGDAGRINMILFNLVKNGIDFRNDHSPRVEVLILQDSNYIKVQVADNGLGIPAKIQDDVFKMFYRGSNHSKGSGLGLYLSARAVDLLKGEIHLASSLQVGTTVTVKIPVESPLL